MRSLEGEDSDDAAEMRKRRVASDDQVMWCVRCDVLIDVNDGEGGPCCVGLRPAVG